MACEKRIESRERQEQGLFPYIFYASVKFHVVTVSNVPAVVLVVETVCVERVDFLCKCGAFAWAIHFRFSFRLGVQKLIPNPRNDDTLCFLFCQVFFFGGRGRASRVYIIRNAHGRAHARNKWEQHICVFFLTYAP